MTKTVLMRRGKCLTETPLCGLLKQSPLRSGARTEHYRTIGHNATPETDDDGALLVEMDVTNPTHRLFGRSFCLITITRTLQSGSHARVEYWPGNPLVLPLGTTSLSPGLADRRARTELTPGPSMRS